MVVQVHGDIDAFSVSHLRQSFRHLLANGHRHFVIDFGQANHFDTIVGIRTIARIWLTVKAYEGSLALVGKPSVREAVATAGLEGSLPVHDTVDAAVRAHPATR